MPNSSSLFEKANDMNSSVQVSNEQATNPFLKLQNTQSVGKDGDTPMVFWDISPGRGPFDDAIHNRLGNISAN